MTGPLRSVAVVADSAGHAAPVVTPAPVVSRPAAAGPRIGVLGCGCWGAKHVRVLNGLREVAAVVAIDPDPARTDAIAAGKPVLIEKPLATSLADARLVCDAAALAGVKLMVGQSFELNPVVRELKRRIASGKLGRIRDVSSARRDIRPALRCGITVHAGTSREDVHRCRRCTPICARPSTGSCRSRRRSSTIATRASPRTAGWSFCSRLRTACRSRRSYCSSGATCSIPRFTPPATPRRGPTTGSLRRRSGWAARAAWGSSTSRSPTANSLGASATRVSSPRSSARSRSGDRPGRRRSTRASPRRPGPCTR